MRFKEDGVAQLDFTDAKLTRQVQLILRCFERSVGKKMFPDMPAGLSLEQQARFVFLADPFIASHDRVQLDDGTPDNVYNFANRSALQFFEVDWETFTKRPSSTSTTADNDFQRERNALLSEAHAKGHAVYSGIRYSTTGKKIQMTDGILFTLFDDRGVYAGQAVLVENLEYIE
eukprot:CAMPEP_0198213274 /NCGR_PEP_ID=MMETSP1445-20131203/28774_1 /TAXON_ID=36898 /ORGANISM="Pyramimonas sp., Strain CCMP2087" /LENGTH=173 /DNA_ID=CAMNT_0043887897 /DNA_START=669 /DNA_END=1190 /DNA_ORIENTATION=-